MAGQLNSAVLVSLLMRQTQSQGGFAAILSRGDESAGAILLLIREKGQILGLRERVMGPKGHYLWQSVGPQDAVVDTDLDPYIQRRNQSDPDLWVVELDIPDDAQFTALLAETA